MMKTDQDNQDRWGWLGQGAAIDLADTVIKTRDNTYEDLLQSYEDFQSWWEVERQWFPERYELRPGDLAEILALRNVIRALFFARSSGDALAQGDVETLNAFALRSPASLALENQKNPIRITSQRASGSSADRLLAHIAESAINILGGPEAEGLRVCSAPSCGMFYVLTRSNQRWCSDLCGNRVRVARHSKKK